MWLLSIEARNYVKLSSKNTNNALPNDTNQKVLTVFPSSDDMIGTGHSMTGSVAAILSEPNIMKQHSS
jgi:hypothetical protein